MNNAIRRRDPGSSNGRTPGSEPGNLGSNPGPGALRRSNIKNFSKIKQNNFLTAMVRAEPGNLGSPAPMNFLKGWRDPAPWENPGPGARQKFRLELASPALS